MPIKFQWPWRVEPKATQVKAEGTPLSQIESWQDFLFGSSLNANGVIPVNDYTAMQSSAVFACVQIISGCIGTLPIHLFQRNGDDLKRNKTHPLNRVLNKRPNDLMNAADFWRMYFSWAFLRGNSYAIIERDRLGRPTGLWCIPSNRVSPYWDPRNRNRVLYALSHHDGYYEVFEQEDILHFSPTPRLDGLKGLAPIVCGANAIGLGLNANSFAERFFSQGVTQDKYLTFPDDISDKQKSSITEWLKQRATGLHNSHIPLILGGGGKFEQLSMKAEDAQLLQTRQFQIQDIARIYQVPPFLIGDNTKVTTWGTGIEQVMIGFTTFTLRPHYETLEQEIENKLFRNSNIEVEYHQDAILRGDFKTRTEGYKALRGGNQDPGIMTINEIRKDLGLPPKEGGDELYKPITGANAAEPEEDETVEEESTNPVDPSESDEAEDV